MEGVWMSQKLGQSPYSNGCGMWKGSALILEKISPTQFAEIQKVFLADIKVQVSWWMIFQMNWPNWCSTCPYPCVDHAPCWWEDYSHHQFRWQTSNNGCSCRFNGWLLPCPSADLLREDKTLLSTSNLSKKLGHLALWKSLVKWKYHAAIHWKIIIPFINQKCQDISLENHKQLWYCLTVFEVKQLPLLSHSYSRTTSLRYRSLQIVLTSCNQWMFQSISLWRMGWGPVVSNLVCQRSSEAAKRCSSW